MQTITIKYNDAKTSKTGKPFWSITDTDGNRYSTWDAKVAGILKKGATASVEVIENNGFSNIQSAVPVSSGGQSSGSDSPNIGLAKSACALFEACYRNGETYEKAKQKVLKALNIISYLQGSGFDSRLRQEIRTDTPDMEPEPAEPQPPLLDEPPAMPSEDSIIDSIPF